MNRPTDAERAFDESHAALVHFLLLPFLAAELPGVSEGDIEVTLDDDMLIIAGEKRQEEEVDEGGMRLVERAFGRFRRAI